MISKTCYDLLGFAGIDDFIIFIQLVAEYL